MENTLNQARRKRRQRGTTHTGIHTQRERQEEIEVITFRRQFYDLDTRVLTT